MWSDLCQNLPTALRPGLPGRTINEVILGSVAIDGKLLQQDIGPGYQPKKVRTLAARPNLAANLHYFACEAIGTRPETRMSLEDEPT